MEQFNANKDCITGMEIPVEDVLEAALEQRFDGLQFKPSAPAIPVHWTYHAALAIMKDLSWRNGIGQVFKGCDLETRIALTSRARDIILSASEDFIRAKDGEIRLLESEVGRLNADFDLERQRRIDAETRCVELEYQLADAKADPVVQLADAKIRLMLAGFRQTARL